jgi:hypothetical protein
MMDTHPEIIAAHYCISFVDLLGQRAEYEGEGLIPQSEDEKGIFLEKIGKTINPIYHLQKDASKYVAAALNYKGTLRETFSEDQQKLYDQMREIKLRNQRWSDGYWYILFLCSKVTLTAPFMGYFIFLE